MINSPFETLKKYWGYENFRPGQLPIINSILSGQDTLAIMPTGGGKSICFQVPGLILTGTTIVISPLISLMKDQVEALCRRGIAAAQLSSSQTEKEKQLVYKNLLEQRLKFIYVSPERLQTKKFLSVCQKIRIGLIVIDEAHCISQWGHDFRPEYQQIAKFVNDVMLSRVNDVMLSSSKYENNVNTLRQAQGDKDQRNIPVAAFTATATPRVRAEIVESLKLSHPQVFISSFKRTNLNLNSIYCPSSFWQNLFLVKLVKFYFGQNGLIYVSSRAAAEQLASYLNQVFDHSYATAYHAGLEKNTRNQIQQAFIDNQKPLVIATNAFGMGIDKSDIRFVIHYHLPSSLEHYYQEVGRAGRDGKSSSCYLLYEPNNLKIHLELINKTAQAENREHVKQTVAKLTAMRAYAQTNLCRSKFILAYFGETATKNCGQCDCCQKKNINPLLLNQKEKELLEKLKRWREAAASRHHLPPTQIATNKILYQIVIIKPQNLAQLKSVTGIGLGWYKNHWSAIEPIMLYNTHL